MGRASLFAGPVRLSARRLLQQPVLPQDVAKSVVGHPQRAHRLPGHQRVHDGLLGGLDSGVEDRVEGVVGQEPRSNGGEQIRGGAFDRGMLARMDPGLLFGAFGIGTAVLSAIYARAQAREARSQVEGMRREAMLKSSRSISDAMLAMRSGLVNSPEIMQEYLAANPQMVAAYGDVDRVRSVIHLRNYLDVMQDVYFLRKEGIVAAYQWRNWVGSFVPFARTPTFRALCENVIARRTLDDEFAGFLQAVLDGKPPPEPRSDLAG